jgi:hypothetical protein
LPPPPDPHRRPAVLTLSTTPRLTLAMGFDSVTTSVPAPPRLLLLPYVVYNLLFDPRAPAPSSICRAVWRDCVVADGAARWCCCSRLLFEAPLLRPDAASTSSQSRRRRPGREGGRRAWDMLGHLSQVATALLLLGFEWYCNMSAMCL